MVVVIDSVNYRILFFWAVVGEEGANVNWRLGEIGKNGIPGSIRPANPSNFHLLD